MVAEQEVVVIRMRGETGARQRALLHQIVVGEFAVQGEAQEPVGMLGLLPVEA